MQQLAMSSPPYSTNITNMCGNPTVICVQWVGHHNTIEAPVRAAWQYNTGPRREGGGRTGLHHPHQHQRAPCPRVHCCTNVHQPGGLEWGSRKRSLMQAVLLPLRVYLARVGRLHHHPSYTQTTCLHRFPQPSRNSIKKYPEFYPRLLPQRFPISHKRKQHIWETHWESWAASRSENDFLSWR